jgi:cell division inhibitor SulA/protein ImuA
MPTGFDALDRELCGGGWMRPGLTEILCDHTGIGELSLLMRGLHRPGGSAGPGDAMQVVWITSPGQAWIPYAPGLAQCGIDLAHFAIVRAKSAADGLWAAEQALKSGACRAVVLRMGDARCSPLSLRRLMQSAIAGNALALMLRPLACASSPSPAGTRIALRPAANGTLGVELLKRRGLPPGRRIELPVRELPCLARGTVLAIPGLRRAQPRAPHETERVPREPWLAGALAGGGSAPSLARERSVERDRR